MSEYVDFHYLPLEGKITGKQVLKQTEDAINDLGNKVYNLDIDESRIDEAIENSEQAINTAEAALSAVTTNRAMWFNTVAEMKSTDIDVGITAATRGKDIFNDGSGAFYAVRTKKSGDTDSDDTVFLDNGSVAERIQQFNFVAKGNNIIYVVNVAELKASNASIDSVYGTVGYYLANDGGAALYTIRAKVPGDVEDGGSIIFLDNDNVAECIDLNIPRTFDVVEDLKNASLFVGLKVSTKGYYSANDGGGATYTIRERVGGETTDDTTAYSKSVPVNMERLEMHELGGKTLVWNQLNNNNSSSQTINGITYTKNSDGSWTLNGTSTNTANKAFTGTVTLTAGHIYYIHGCPSGGGSSSYALGFSGISTDTGNGGIWTATLSSAVFRFNCVSGVTFNNVTMYPQYHDLTLMFGAGNEPSTVAEFEAMFPADYYEYNEGTLLSAGVTEVVSKKADTTTIATYPIPTAIRNLEGYGWSAGTAYNYIDFERKVFVKRVGRVVLNGTQGIKVENWRPKDNSRAWGYYPTMANVKIATQNILTVPLKTVTYGSIYDNDVSSISASTNGLYSFFVRVADTSLSTSTAINAYLSANPITVYYELATPVETDISQYLTDNLIEVGAGGTLTFPNSNGDDYRIPVPNEETFSYGDVDDGGSIIILNNDNVAELITDGTVNVKQFGAKGDGATDDTTAIQNACKFPVVTMNDNDDYFVTSQITIENDIRIEGNNAKITQNADIDFLLFEQNQNYLEVRNLNFVKQDNSFEKYNRAIRAEYIDCVIVDNLTFENFGTCVHDMLGNKFVCKNIYAKDVHGIDTQYGYGVDTSARNNTIDNINGYNTSDDNGRHLVYLNGDIGEFASISNIKCINWHHNPINLKFKTPSIVPKVYVSDVYFDNVNAVPLSSAHTVADVHITGDVTGEYFIKNVVAVNQKFIVVGSTSNVAKVNIENVHATYIEESDTDYSGFSVVRVEGGANPVVKGIYLHNWYRQLSDVVKFDTCTNAIADNIINEATTNTLSALLYAVNSSVNIGNFITDGTSFRTAGTSSVKSLSQLAERVDALFTIASDFTSEYRGSCKSGNIVTFNEEISFTAGKALKNATLFSIGTGAVPIRNTYLYGYTDTNKILQILVNTNGEVKIRNVTGNQDTSATGLAISGTYITKQVNY